MSETVLGMWVAINMQIKDELFIYSINSKIDGIKFLNYTQLFSNYKFSNKKREGFLLINSLDFYVFVYPCCLAAQFKSEFESRLY